MSARFVWIACLVASSAACGARESGADVDAGTDATNEAGACVAYEGAPSDGRLPIDGSLSSTSAPACAPRCGASRVDGFWSADALPTGACSGDATCSMGARPHCGCSEARGPVNDYRCSCVSGQWSCVIATQGGSICRDSCPDAGGDAPVSTDCAPGRLPTAGTACDPAAWPTSTYCRLASCGWGGENECWCDAGHWKCEMTARDDYGCGSAPYCHENVGASCSDAGTGSSGFCPSGTFALSAMGPWNDAKGCWPSTYQFFECADGPDGGTAFTCFVRVSSGQFFLAGTTQIPSGTDYRPCTDAERSTHLASTRCE